MLEDSDGSLTVADKNLRLKGVGRVGNTVQVSSVKLIAGAQPLSCLEVAVCSNGLASFSSSSIISTSQTIHSNGEVSSSGTVNSDVEAVGSIFGGGYNGTLRGQPTLARHAFPSPTRQIASHGMAKQKITHIFQIPMPM